MVQDNLGLTLLEQGLREGGETRRLLLTQAVEAFRGSLEVRTFEALPPQWAMTHANLARASAALGQREAAAQSHANVLRVNPDDERTYTLLATIYHQQLFYFEAELNLHRSWLERHPDDVSALMRFAEDNFTTGRFAEAEKRTDELVARPGLDASSRAVLLALKMAAGLAQQKTQIVAEELHQLVAVVSTQPEDFVVTWFWEGTKHFISTDERLSHARDRLVQILSALQAQNRAAILTALKAAEAGDVADSKR